ncbi:50S ribosomal protein L30 [Acetobacteraceae bacterium]|nr:50S ribosomal protein L30 [Acetobacteraceae bacterium]QCE34275.1 50S ribosomal protein L30 [Acetobacteraceae bacterium]
MAKKQLPPVEAGKVRVIRTGSLIRSKPGQAEAMRGLGLRRIGAVRELEDTPAIRGMIRVVAHLVKVENHG